MEPLSNILNYVSLELMVYIIIGLGVFSLLLFILVIVCLAKIGGLKKKYRKFMEGSEAKSLESLIQEEVAEISNLKDENGKRVQEIASVNQMISGCYQKIGIERYDSMAGMGGQVSFVLTMLDQNNTGIMLNSIHTREGNYLYMKEIKEGRCGVTLGKEEQKSLEKAIVQ